MMKLDATDARIVQALQADGRRTNAQLAEIVGLSASACSRRVQELERTGVIRGYRAVIDPVALGGGFAAFIAVRLSTHTRDAQKEFERAICASPAVVACHNVTGAIEYLLRVDVADINAYKRFHTDVLGASPHVAGITTYVVMETPKDALG